MPRVCLLELQDLTIAAGGKTLLSGVNLCLQDGETIALCGPSGYGKTSLLRTMCGLDDAAAGKILLQGRSPGDWSYPEFRRRVLYVEQRPVLFEGTIEANLRRPFGRQVARDLPFPVERARELAARLLLPADQSQKARTLSQGQQQRWGLIRALLLSPLVLLLDEPTSALDNEAAQAVENLLCEEASRGLAIVLVTHDSAFAARCDHRCYVTAFAPMSGVGKARSDTT